MFAVGNLTKILLIISKRLEHFLTNNILVSYLFLVICCDKHLTNIVTTTNYPIIEYFVFDLNVVIIFNIYA